MVKEFWGSFLTRFPLSCQLPIQNVIKEFWPGSIFYKNWNCEHSIQVWKLDQCTIFMIEGFVGSFLSNCRWRCRLPIQLPIHSAMKKRKRLMKDRIWSKQSVHLNFNLQCGLLSTIHTSKMVYSCVL